MTWRVKYGPMRGLEAKDLETNWLLTVLKEAKASIPAIEAELTKRNVDFDGPEKPIRTWQNEDRYLG
jgi:hypothetical protein